MLIAAGLVPFPLNNEITMYWTMWGTIGTAFVTVLLALFAAFAWKTSRRTLAEMRTQASEDLEERQTAREIAALADYLRALSEISSMQHKAPETAVSLSDVDDSDAGDIAVKYLEANVAYQSFVQLSLAAPITHSGAIWRLHHYRNEPQLGQLLSAERALVESIRRLQVLEGVHRWKGNMRCNRYAESFADLLRDWQMDESIREQRAADAEQLAVDLRSSMNSYVSKQLKDEHASQESGKL